MCFASPRNRSFPSPTLCVMISSGGNFLSSTSTVFPWFPPSSLCPIQNCSHVMSFLSVNFFMPNSLPSSFVSQPELLTILVCLNLWPQRLRGVVILTDNQVSAYALNNQRLSNFFMQRCLRELSLCLLLALITARHVSGKVNVLADALSRCHLDSSYSDYRQYAYITTLNLTQVFSDSFMFDFTVF